MPLLPSPRPAAFAVLAAALLLPPAALAQQAPAAPAVAVRAEGTVAGVAFDSLLMRPLAGANVFLPAAGLGAVSDSLGRYRIERVPEGPQVVTFSHTALDALGLTTLGERVTVAAGRETPVLLATPSLATLRARACGDEAAEQPPGRTLFGLVFGTVRAADESARLAGATVTARWLVADSSSGRLRIETLSSSVASDSAGGYYLCNVPIGRDLFLLADGGERSTGRLDLALDGRGVARVDLVLARPDSAAGPAAGVVAGAVRDTTGRPIPNARVTIDGVDRPVRTGADGRFRLAGVPAGSRMLEIAAPGLAATRRAIGLAAGDSLQLDLTVGGGVLLAPVTVRATPRRLGPELRGFDTRRQEGRGIFLDSLQIRSQGSVRAAVNALPSVRLDGIYTNWVAFVPAPNGGQCSPTVWVDGRLSDWGEVSSLPAESMAAMEWYSRITQVPQRFIPPRAQNCAVAVFWTNGAH